MAGGTHSDDKIKEAFQRVKQDMNSLKETLFKQNEEIKALKEEIKRFSSPVDEIEDNLDSKETSIGNEGVVDDGRRWSTMVDDGQRWTTMDNDDQRSKTSKDIRPSIPDQLKSTVKTLDRTLTSRFKALSDREFSIFMVLYELGKELPEVTYAELAKRMSVSESTIKTMVNRVISKDLPIKKERFLNKKVSLSIDKSFYDLNLLNKLIALRQQKDDQKTLLDL